MRFRKKVQMIFQDPYTSFNPRQRVGAAMDEVLRVHGVNDDAERTARIL
jgi:ABC-type microcin C transport system duplicated ATPase subunit YejF